MRTSFSSLYIDVNVIPTMKQNKQTVDIIETHFRLLDMLYFIIWFGVLSGLAGIIFLRMKGFVGGATVYLLCHTMWMTPTVNVAILGIAGLAALPVVMRLSRPLWIPMGTCFPHRSPTPRRWQRSRRKFSPRERHINGTKCL